MYFGKSEWTYMTIMTLLPCQLRRNIQTLYLLFFHYNSIGPKQLVYKYINLCACASVSGGKTFTL